MPVARGKVSKYNDAALQSSRLYDSFLRARRQYSHDALRCGRDAYLDAVKSGNDAAAVRALIAQKVDVNAAAADSSTALHWAVQPDNLEIVGPADRRGRQRQGERRATTSRRLVAGLHQRERDDHRASA